MHRSKTDWHCIDSALRIACTFTTSSQSCVIDWGVMMSQISPSILFEFHQKRPLKYIVSFLIVCLTTLIQKLIWPWIDPAPFLLFYPAVIIASLYGDGISSIFWSVLSIQFFFIPPLYSFDVGGQSDIFRMLAYIASAIAIRMIINTQMHERLKAESAVLLLTQREKDLEMERDTRERFVATLTHDLQTPLTAIKLNLQIAEKTTPPEILPRIEKSLGSLNRMQAMIQDLLDVNSIRAGKPLPIEINECHLNTVAEETLADLRQIHGDRFIMVHNKDLQGHWSCNGVRRIIENLCSNAVKYGKENAPVKIVLEEGDTYALIQVHNEGTPIPEADQKVLFNPFERASEKTGKKKGWGLGLTLVKGLAEAQGGKVIVTSAEGMGTTFSVYLPHDAREHVSQNLLT